MSETYLRGFDVNLIRVFLAVWETRNLTATANRLGLTQPAISHALKRLREQFDDPLFVRGAKGMMPTEIAAGLHEPFNSAFQIIGRAIQERNIFTPAVSSRTFRIAMSDLSEIYFLPKLLAWLEEHGPAVKVEILPLNDNISTLLKIGDVDLAIGYLPQLDEDYSGVELFTDSLICLVRAGHPFADRTLTLEHLAQLRYIDAGIIAPGHPMVDHLLAELSHKRDIVMKVRYFMTAPELIRGTNLAAIFLESLARDLNQENEFHVLQLPIALPRIDVRVHTHRRFSKDAGVAWLLGGIRSLFADR